MKPVVAEPDDKVFAWPEDFPYLPHLRFSTHGNKNVTEVMETYRIACEQLGFSTSIEPKLSVDHNDINIWFFAMGLNWTSDADLPLNTIVVNLEPRLPELLSKMPVYRHLLQRAWVWDYSMDNIKHHKSLGIHRSEYVPLTFEPKATPILPEDQSLHDAEQDIDVIFFGERTPRRLAILKELESRELNVVYPTVKPWTPAERDALLLRAKIGLNISKDDSTATAEMARFSILLRNRKAVVSELYPHSEIPSQLRDALDGCSYNKLVERTVKLLGDAPRRHMLETRAVAALNNLTPQKDILRDAMRTYVQAVRQHMQRKPKVPLREDVSLESVDMNSETNVGAAVLGIDQIWLINLDRRSDRLERFMRSHPEMAGRINRLSAYDGKSLELTPELARLFLPNNFQWHKPTMGCALSHLALWQKLAGEPDQNASYLILEDDALLAPCWLPTVEKAFISGKIPPDWEIVYLGGILPKYRKHFDGNIELVNRSIARVKAGCVFGKNPPGYYHFCAYAYLLSKRGAMRILEIIKRGNGIWMQADFLAAYHTPQLAPPRKIFFFHPLIAGSFQDLEEGYAKPYAEETDEAFRVDSDIWRVSAKFTDNEVSHCRAADLPLDIPKALGWNENTPMASALPRSAAQKACHLSIPLVEGTENSSRILLDGKRHLGKVGRVGVSKVLKPEDIPSIFGTSRSACNAIALCADQKFFPYASVAIISLLENGGCEDVPLFFFSESFDSEDMDKFDRLRSMASGRLHLVELSDQNLKALPSVRHMSRATFIRLRIPEILRSFGTILYLDSDILVVSEVSSVFKTEFQGRCIAAVRDLVGEKTCKIGFFRSGEEAYFNAGVLLINSEHWMRAGIGDKVLKLARNDEEREKLSTYADQCLLNYVIRGDFVALEREFNWSTFEPSRCSDGLLGLAPSPSGENLSKAKILHFVGEVKPWMPSSTLREIWTAYEAVAKRSPWYKDIMANKRPQNCGQRLTAPSRAAVAVAPKKLPGGRWDYISPNLVRVYPDEAFPHMVIGDVNGCGWHYLRREIPHNWYIDRRTKYIGFATRDEAAILFNTALEFAGKTCLEIGCWMGWSAAHILMAGTELDIIDPVFGSPLNAESVQKSLAMVAKRSPRGAKVIAHAGYSPAKLAEIAAEHDKKWHFAFIDGDHEGDGPLRDAQECEKHLQNNAMVLFHDLASPFVAKGLDFFRDCGWRTRIYNTMQIMGVAWRGNVSPVDHQPDPRVQWDIPAHLDGYEISDCSFDADTAEFERIYRVIKPYTMVGRPRLFALYCNALQICRENIPGDFVECGACRGGSAALLAYVAKTHSRVPRKVYACDTFEGMPEPGAADCHKGMDAAQCGFPAGSLRAPIETGLSEVARRAGVADIVTPVKGLFRDTLPGLAAKIGPLSLLHADGDWYDSTMDIFRNLFEKVSAGGYVQIDDYGHWEGCRRAVEDYQKIQGIKFFLEQIDYTGFGFRKV